VRGRGHPPVGLSRHPTTLLSVRQVEEAGVGVVHAVRTYRSRPSWWAASLLRGLRQDYIIEPGERDTTGIALAQVPERAELRDFPLPPRELAMAVTSVLQILHNYRAALMATGA